MWKQSVLPLAFLLFFSLNDRSVLSENSFGSHDQQELQELDDSSVIIAITVRNKAHVLPYFFYYLEHLDYPKSKIGLWIRSDHNEDNSTAVVERWLSHMKKEYHFVDMKSDDSVQTYEDASKSSEWTIQRYKHMINLRQEALETARNKFADYLLFLDADNLLSNPSVLKKLMAKNVPIIAPMLNNTMNEYYSNFWCGMNEKGYYQRKDEYYPYLRRHEQGTFKVAMVHSTVLINLRDRATRQLAYSPPPRNHNGPVDDIIRFAQSAKYHGVSMYLLNDDFYGWMLIPDDYEESQPSEIEQFNHLKLENIEYDTRLQNSKYLPVFPPPKDKMGFDQVYVINLKRRPDRRYRMDGCLDELGIEAKYVDAVDGKKLNQSYLDSLGIKMLPGYRDPYQPDRPLTMGEIGCFLSHYFIWQDVVRNQYKKIVIFEDDLRFEHLFRKKLQWLQEEAQQLGIEWDLLYIGRKKMKHKEEYYVKKAKWLVWPNYSYWTLGYLLTFEGASKLLEQEPLQKLLPVDEYLPIMFDKHPKDEYLESFSPRNLVTLSSEPLLVYPTHYTGEPGYITDTENAQWCEDCEKGDEENVETEKKDEL